MATYTITTRRHSFTIDVSDVAQIAALQSARSRWNDSVPLSPDQALEDHDDYCATEGDYLNRVMGSWADSNPNATEQDVRDTVARALASYAGQDPPEVIVDQSGPLTVEALLAYAAHKRWQVEVGGTTWNGHRVHTDRESQTKMLAAYVQLGGGLRQDPSPWKLADGYIMATNAQMSEIITAALTHVQRAFATEHQLEAGIKAIPPTITTKDQIDLAFTQ